MQQFGPFPAILFFSYMINFDELDFYSGNQKQWIDCRLLSFNLAMSASYEEKSDLMSSIKYIFKVFYTFLILDLVETLQHLHSAWAKPLSFLPRTRIQTSMRTINKHIIHLTSTVNNIFNVVIKGKLWIYATLLC